MGSQERTLIHKLGNLSVHVASHRKQYRQILMTAIQVKDSLQTPYTILTAARLLATCLYQDSSELADFHEAKRVLTDVREHFPGSPEFTAWLPKNGMLTLDVVKNVAANNYALIEY